MKQIEGVVVSLSAEQVFVDIGYKTEGVLPLSAFPNNAEGVKAGDKIPVSVKGRNEEHYYELSASKLPSPATGLLSKKLSRKNSPSSAPSPVSSKADLPSILAFAHLCRPAVAERAMHPNSKNWSAPKSTAASPNSTSPTKTWSSTAVSSSKSRRAFSRKAAWQPCSRAKC